jgi:hypothetical protein
VAPGAALGDVEVVTVILQTLTVVHDAIRDVKSRRSAVDVELERLRDVAIEDDHTASVSDPGVSASRHAAATTTTTAAAASATLPFHAAALPSSVTPSFAAAVVGSNKRSRNGTDDDAGNVATPPTAALPTTVQPPPAPTARVSRTLASRLKQLDSAEQ